jgi:hypothetical protein
MRGKDRFALRTIHTARCDDAVALKHGCAPGGIAAQD